MKFSLGIDFTEFYILEQGYSHDGLIKVIITGFELVPIHWFQHWFH